MRQFVRVCLNGCSGGNISGCHRVGTRDCHSDLFDRIIERSTLESGCYGEYGGVVGFHQVSCDTLHRDPDAGRFCSSNSSVHYFRWCITGYENENNLTRGALGSEGSAMVFGEFFPNPGGKPLDMKGRERVSTMSAFGTEVIGTAILLLVIFCVTDKQNESRPQLLTAATIGLTITLLISLLGPLTMACFNPARDFAPRLFSSLVGWGSVPFSANGHGWLTVYIIAPLVGGLLGGGIYYAFFKPAYRAQEGM